MRHAARNSVGRSVQRRGTLFSVLLATTMAAIVGAQPSLADSRESPKPSAQDQVEDLVVCYARGTDALGRATTAAGGQALDSTFNVGNPEFDEGLELYRSCFAKEFSFNLLIDGAFLLTVPDPATRTPDTDAALQWANFVNNTFRGSGYRNTQHQMGSISSTVNRNRGSVVSYLIATHAFGPSSVRTGVEVVGGTYSDDVVRKRGRWLIQTRTLNVTSSVTVPAGL